MNTSNSHSNSLHAIMDSLKAGYTFGQDREWDYYNSQPLRYAYFDKVLYITTAGSIGWTHYGSSASKCTLKDLAWVIKTIFDTTPDRFLQQYKRNDNSLLATYDSNRDSALQHAWTVIESCGYECNAATWNDIVIDITEGIVPIDHKFESITEYIYRQFEDDTDNSDPDNSDPDNSQPTGPIYDNPLQILQDYDTTALNSLTEEQQDYLRSFLDFESYAFTVAGNSVTAWDPIGWDVLNTCSLGEFVIDALREARDAEPAE